jgi:L-ascorbate metabolism protein UlaG (beta-lactamase superfamily)
MEDAAMDIQAFVKDKVKWLGHAGFRIEGSSVVVYIDPWKLKSPTPADVICITHSHFDHLSEEDVKLIRKPSTVIIGPPDCKAGFGDSFRAVKPGETITVGDVIVEAVPAYNTDKEFHPKKNNWLGFVITVDSVRVYHTGDSDMIPEMAAIKADVALVPVGGTYTMTVEQAAKAVSGFAPKVAVPMHCGDIEAFSKAAGVPVVILDPQ